MNGKLSLPYICLIVIVLITGNVGINCQNPATIRVISSVKVEETSNGATFKLFEANLQSHITRASENRFQLIIPNAAASIVEGTVYSGKPANIRSERKGADAVFTFLLTPGNIVTTERYLDRLHLLIGPPSVENASTGPGFAAPKPRISQSSVVATSEPANGGAPAEPPGRETPEVKIGGSGQGGLRITRVTGPPSFNDLLKTPTSPFGSEVADFRQYTPGDGTPVSQNTRAFLAYDNTNLYVAFVCRDEPGHVRAHMAKRGDISGDDSVSVILDTFRDQRRAYVFSVNPLGVQRDAITTEGQGSDESFDAVWYSEGRVTADGYVVLLEIPFKSLRFSNAEVQSWGLALKRTIARNNEEAYFPYITQRKNGFLGQTAALDGVERVSAGRNVQITPYYVASADRYRDATTDPAQMRTDVGVRGGLDAKVVLKNAITVDLTVNPDFSQVESDEPQVTVNRRFESYFPEKRPFFIENAAFFQTPENLFFSRRIVDPQFGIRATGKMGKWALGGLLIDDKAPRGFQSLDGRGSGRRAVVGVVRAQREFGDQSSLGVLVSNYDRPSGKNRVVSADSRVKLSENWSFTGQLSRSSFRGPDGNTKNGSAYLANLTRSGRSLNYYVGYLERSRDFKAELGFIPRTDIREAYQGLSYTWRPNQKGIVSIDTTGFVSGGWDTKSRLQDWYVSGEANINFTGLTGVGFNRSRAYELFIDQGFDTEKTSVSFYSDRFEWLGLYGSYYWGTGINYSPAMGLSASRAESSGGHLSLAIRPNTRFSFQQSYIQSRLRSELRNNGRAENIYYNHVLRSKLNYQFNRELSLRFIADYYAVLPNSTLVELQKNKQLTTDILLTYLISPGTAMYIGYTDGYESLDDVFRNHAGGRPRSASFSSSGRRFFVKVNNLFRF